MFIENHRYLIWFSREVDAHSYLDIVENQDWRWLAEYKPAFSNLDIPEMRTKGGEGDAHVRL